MKIIVLKSNFVEALSAVERAVGSGSDLPILKNVLIRTEGSKIMVVSTNLEFAITYTFSGKIIEQGESVIPFSILYSIIRNINSERVTLELKEGKMLITSENYEAIIQVYDAKEYPIIPSVHEHNSTILINTKELTESLANVLVATQYSEIRPEISGVCLKNDSQELFFVATDSFRLAEKKLSNVKYNAKSGDIRVIIPFRTAEEILRIMAGQGEKDVSVEIDATQILFKTDTVSIISRLIDGNFPEYKQIIPTTTNIELYVSRQEIMNAIKLTSSFSGKLNDITIIINEDGKFIELSSSDSAIGQNAYKIPAKIKGKGITISFNWKYLLDGIKIFSGNEIVIGINDRGKPIKIQNPHNSGLVYILMPINN